MLLIIIRYFIHNYVLGLGLNLEKLSSALAL